MEKLKLPRLSSVERSDSLNKSPTLQSKQRQDEGLNLPIQLCEEGPKSSRIYMAPQKSKPVRIYKKSEALSPALGGTSTKKREEELSKHSNLVKDNHSDQSIFRRHSNKGGSILSRKNSMNFLGRESSNPAAGKIGKEINMMKEYFVKRSSQEAETNPMTDRPGSSQRAVKSNKIFILDKQSTTDMSLERDKLKLSYLSNQMDLSNSQKLCTQRPQIGIKKRLSDLGSFCSNSIDKPLQNSGLGPEIKLDLGNNADNPKLKTMIVKTAFKRSSIKSEDETPENRGLVKRPTRLIITPMKDEIYQKLASSLGSSPKNLSASKGYYFTHLDRFFSGTMLTQAPMKSSIKEHFLETYNVVQQLRDYAIVEERDLEMKTIKINNLKDDTWSDKYLILDIDETLVSSSKKKPELKDKLDKLRVQHLDIFIGNEQVKVGEID